MVPEDEVVKIGDDGLSFVAAAATAMGAFVGHDMLRRAAPRLSSGGRCLVLGASGALGTVLLQLLRHREPAVVHVTAVCSGKNADAVRGAGAHEVVDYAVAPFATQLAAAEQFDVAFDFVGGKEAERGAASLLAPGGVYVTAVGPVLHMGKDRKLSARETFASLGHILRKSLGCRCGGARYRYAMSQASPPLTAEAWRATALEAGARAVIAEEVPFAEAPIREALRRAASHHAGGRLVINMVK